MVATGIARHDQGIHLPGGEIVVHIERSPRTRQGFHGEIEILPRVAELDATAIEGQVGDVAVTDHHPPGVAVDGQLADIVEAAGQGRLILQSDIGRRARARHDVTHQVAVIDRHVRRRCAIDLQDCAVATHQGGAVVHFDRGQDGRQAEVVDDNRRAGLPLHQGAVQYQAAGHSGSATGQE
ncbi:hypothetical protein D9M69_500250 [compost metagenome]